MKHLGALLITLLLTATIHAQTVVTYPHPSIYARSANYSLKINGTTVPVVAFVGGYDYAHLSMSGTVTVELTSLTATSITSYRISPKKLNITGTVSGSKLTFTMPKDGYLIVKINDQREVVIAADPLETERPASSGTGIFNVTAVPYNADKTGTRITSSAIQAAINDCSNYTAGQGIVYIPAGVYLSGNIVLKSNVYIYMEGGAIIRGTGNPADYTVNFRKASQNRNGTWFIYTAENANNIKIYGRGTIDGNGHYMANTNNFGNHLLVPLGCSNFTVDGILFRDSGSWGVVTARSNNLTFKNYKHFNALNTGEDDGIDVCESQNVLVQHSVAVALDDPYSTKTWNGGDLPVNWYGVPEPNSNITFDDCLAFTYCAAFKVGQGVLQPQSDITFKNSVVYDCSTGIAVHHKYGSAEAKDITFDNIDIEAVNNSCIGSAWLTLLVENGGSGVGPISNVNIKNINVRARGPVNVTFRSTDGAAPITGVTIDNVRMLGNARPVSSLAELNVVSTTNASGISIIPSGSPSRRQAEYHNSAAGVSTALTGDVDGGSHLTSINNTDWVGYNKVDFGGGSTSIHIRYASPVSGGTIQIRLGSTTGTLIGTDSLPATGGFTTWKTKSITIANTKGEQNVFFVFAKADFTGFAYINWFEVIRPSDPVTVYDDCGYSANPVSLAPGDYTLAQLQTAGVLNKHISSLKITSGYEVQLFLNDNFTGRSVTVKGDNTCLVFNNFNDSTTSLKIRAAGVTTLSGTYYLQNRNSGLYMDVYDASTDNSVAIDQWHYNGQTNQQFEFTHLGSGFYKIVAKHSNKSLNVEWGYISDGSRLVQYPYGGSNNEQFLLAPTGDGYYKLIIRKSNKLVEVSNFSTAGGAIVQEWTDLNQTSGQWKLIPVTVTARTAAATPKIIDTNEDLLIYPNPVDHTLSIKSTGIITGKARIINATGVEVLNTTMNGNSINVSALQPGFYTLIFMQGNKRIVKKFIKSATH